MWSAGRNKEGYLPGPGSFDGYKRAHFSFKLKYASPYDYTSNQKNLYIVLNPLRIKDRVIKPFPKEIHVKIWE